MGIVVPLVFALLMFTTSRGMSDPEALFDFASASGRFSPEQLDTLSGGVRQVHQRRFGSSLREMAFLLYPLSFLALAGLHLVLGVSRQVDEIHQQPNKAPEPTPGAVTSRAD
jgi:hypothetical protein